MRKGLICGVLRDVEIGDCSNDGISSNHDTVLLLFDEEEAQVFEESEGRPTVKLVRRKIAGKDYVHAEPVEGTGYMFGGAFIYSSDTRFGLFANQYPIALHDRKEH